MEPTAMSRDLGDFAMRGVAVREGGKLVPVPTPALSLMRCRHCRAKGVSVTALAEDGHLLGWCLFEHARADGLRLPSPVVSRPGQQNPKTGAVRQQRARCRAK
jgi:hypothetical protein